MAHASGTPQPLPLATPPAEAGSRGRLAPALTWLRNHWQDPLYRNGYFLMLNSASAAGFGFLFWMIAARVYDRATVGWGVGVVSAMTLAALLGKFGVDAALIRYVPAAGTRQRRKLVLGSLAMATALTLACASVLLFLFPTLLPVLAPLREEPVYAILFMTFAAAMSATWVFDGYFIAERRAGLTLAKNLVLNGTKVLIPLIGIAAASRFGIPIAFGTAILLSVATAVLFLPHLWRRAPAANGPLIGKRAFLAYASVNYVVNVSEWLPSLVLPLIVLALLGAEANATFYIAWTLAGLAFFLTKAVSQSTFAEMSHDPHRLGHHLRKGAKHSAAVVVPFLLFGSLLGSLILQVFGPEYAREGYPILLLLLASSVFVAVVNLYLTLLKARDARTELVLLPAALLALALAGAYVLLPLLGLPGLGAAWLGANVIVATYALTRIPTHLRRSAACPPPASTPPSA